MSRLSEVRPLKQPVFICTVCHDEFPTDKERDDHELDHLVDPEEGELP